MFADAYVYVSFFVFLNWYETLWRVWLCVAYSGVNIFMVSPFVVIHVLISQNTGNTHLR